MIDIETVLSIHDILIKEFGGGEGVRNLHILESAINRPFQTFGENELYPTTVDKAAALIESIVKNHPFVDGNKRTGYVMMRLLLMNNGLNIAASEDDKYNFVINIANGKIDYENIRSWILSRLVEEKK